MKTGMRESMFGTYPMFGKHPSDMARQLRSLASLLAFAALLPLAASAQADANWVRSTRMLDSTGVRRAVAVDYADGLGRPGGGGTGVSRTNTSPTVPAT